jgi:membrane protease YdiL (CAAX protease family)
VSTTPTTAGRALEWRRRLGLGDEDRWRAAVVLATSVLLLIAAWHWGRPGAFRDSALEEWVVDALGDTGEEFRGALAYVFFGVATVFWRILLPLGVIVLVLRSRPGEFGYRVRGLAGHLPAYGLLFLVMVPLIVWASSQAAFQATYPFHHQAVEGGMQFWVYELGYWVQFVALEAFFRGYVLFGLAPAFGAVNAVLMMTVPYVMVHFGKPTLEVFAAAGAGLVLGYLALRSRSWVGGAILHILVAFTMDFSAIARAAGGIDEALGLIF